MNAEKEYRVEFSLFNSKFRTKIKAKSKEEVNEKLSAFVQNKLVVDKVAVVDPEFEEMMKMAEDFLKTFG